MTKYVIARKDPNGGALPNYFSRMITGFADYTYVIECAHRFESCTAATLTIIALSDIEKAPLAHYSIKLIAE